MEISIEEKESGRVRSIQSNTLPDCLASLASQGICATAWLNGHRVGSVRSEQGKLLWWCNGDASVEMPTRDDFNGVHHVCNLAATGDLELGIGDLQSLQRVMTAHAYGLDLRCQVVDMVRNLIGDYKDCRPKITIDSVPEHGQRPVSITETESDKVLALLECVGSGERSFYLHCWDTRLLAKPSLGATTFKDAGSALAAVRDRLQLDPQK